MHFVSIQTVPEMHLLLSRIGISMVIWSTKVHFVSIPNCARNAFVSESDWQAHAFKWSFGAPKNAFHEHSNGT